jgi:DNA-binding LacI/PurR family transcriptional regulator
MKIIGFDNIQLGRYVKPALTTIDINRAEWSRMLAETIVGVIEDRPEAASNYRPEYRIIRRESF